MGNDDKVGSLRIKQSDAIMADVQCIRDDKDKLIKVMDYQGNLLTHFAEARSVLWKGQSWFY
jgi:hypothetical protein